MQKNQESQRKEIRRPSDVLKTSVYTGGKWRSISRWELLEERQKPTSQLADSHIQVYICKSLENMAAVEPLEASS